MQETQGLGEASNLLPMGSQASNTFLYFFLGGGFSSGLFCFATDSSMTLEIQFQTVPHMLHAQDYEESDPGFHEESGIG